MNNPKIFDDLWKHFSFIGNQGHRINEGGGFSEIGYHA